MKRWVVVISLLVMVATAVFGQERTKMVLELKNGSTVTGFVMEQENGSYMVETESGDILFYNRDEVKNFKKMGEDNTGLIQTLRRTASAAIYPAREENVLKRSGFSLVFKDSGIDLQQDQVSDVFWSDYKSASRRKKSGMKLMIIGGASALAGAVGYLSFGETYFTYTSYSYDSVGNRHSSETTSKYTNTAGYICWGVVAAGAGLATLGTIKFLAGNAGLGRLAKQFNSANGYASELSFDYSPAGIALVYRF